MENNSSKESSSLIREKTGLSTGEKIWATVSAVALFVATITIWTNEIPDVNWYDFEKWEEVWATQIKWKRFFNYSEKWENFVEMNNYTLNEKDLEKVKNLALALRFSKKLEDWETYIVKEFLVRKTEGEIFIWYIWIDWKNYNSKANILIKKAREVLERVEQEIKINLERWCEWVIKLWWDLCIEWQDLKDIKEHILSKKESWETEHQVDDRDDLERTEREWFDEYWEEDWKAFNYDKTNEFVKQTLKATVCVDKQKAEKALQEIKSLEGGQDYVLEKEILYEVIINDIKLRAERCWKENLPESYTNIPNIF